MMAIKDIEPAEENVEKARGRRVLKRPAAAAVEDSGTEKRPASGLTEEAVAQHNSADNEQNDK
eukprot:8876431-Lingulodinium_polyedra.AAC.1